jgi:glycosyltransferase involved in cell wall biosynthesis
MKIVHVCPFVGEQMGGSERYVDHLSAIQSKKHDVHVYTTTSHSERAGIDCTSDVTYHRFYSPLVIWNINPLSFILPALLKADADILHIHSHLYFISNQAVLAKIFRSVKGLLQVHGGVGTPPYRTSFRTKMIKHVYDVTLGRVTLNNSDIIASVSKKDITILHSRFHLPEEKLRYVPNAVDTDVFHPPQDEQEKSNTLLFLGDLEPWKGIGTLIEWINDPAIWPEFDITIRFVGQGRYYPVLLKLKDKLKSANSRLTLEVLGQKPHEEIPAILQEADALLFPSFWEGMPTVVLEAMACGTPVICTRAGDLPNHIQNGVNGFLINRTARSLKNALKSLYSSETDTKGLRQQARHLIEKEFSYSHASQELESVYAEMLSMAK